jgi:L-lactate dehydrogenase
LHSGAADELLLNDLRSEIAEGEAMDLAHGAAFYPSASVRMAAIEEMTDADAVVVTAGRNGKVGESRLELLRDNSRVIRDIGRKLKGCRGVIILVANPVDVLTQVMTETAGLPRGRVLGTGTMLDTARFRHVIGRTLGVDTRSIHGQIVGEHGDSQVVLWSGARVGGVALRQWPNWDRNQEQGLADEVRTAAYEIIRRKGATNHAIDDLRALINGDTAIHFRITINRAAHERDDFFKDAPIGIEHINRLARIDPPAFMHVRVNAVSSVHQPLNCIGNFIFPSTGARN